MILSSKNNPILPNGKFAFDLRDERNNICVFGQKKIEIETPVRFGGGAMGV